MDSGKFDRATSGKRYEVWHSPARSFFCKTIYRNAALDWGGLCLGYMFLLSTIAWTATIFFTVLMPCYELMNNAQVNSVINQIPKMKYANGKLNIDRPCPYKLTDGNGVAWAVFKTDKPGVPAVGSDDPPLVIGQDGFIPVAGVVAGMDASSHMIRYATDPSEALYKTKFDFDGPSFLQIMHTVLMWLPIVLWLIGLPFVWATHAFFMLLYGSVVWIAGRFTDRMITFPGGMRVAAVALTPAMMLTIFCVGLGVLLLPLKIMTAIVTYAPVHSYAFHHIFPISSMLITWAYLIFGIVSVEPSKVLASASVPDLSSGGGQA